MFKDALEAVRDPLWKHIYIPSKLYEATKTMDFVRLTRIRQLGPTQLIYPGATHTRASHSFGVYHIAVLLLERLLQNGADKWTTTEGCKSFAAAALFHDLGHFPYTHSLKELPLIEHEVLTARQILQQPLYDIIGAWGADPKQTAAIIDKEIDTDDTQTLFFRCLLSGVLDPDKLDYLNRDAFFCGVPYGIQDTDFILSKIYPDKIMGISIDSSAISTVENILFSKYLMYGSVYWHKQVRIATAMMKKVLVAALDKDIITSEQLYSLDDEQLFYLLEKKHNEHNNEKFSEYYVAQELREQRLYSVVLELPFDEHNEKHIQLENLQNRTKAENVIAEKLGCKSEHIIIDIPERISFESNLPISDLNVSFSQSPTVFSKSTVKSFVSSLRNIRIGVDKKNVVISSKDIENIIAIYV